MLIILVLIAAMMLIVIANSTTLFWVKQEILRIEERQQRGEGMTQAGRRGEFSAPPRLPLGAEPK